VLPAFDWKFTVATPVPWSSACLGWLSLFGRIHACLCVYVADMTSCLPDRSGVAISMTYCCPRPGSNAKGVCLGFRTRSLAVLKISKNTALAVLARATRLKTSKSAVASPLASRGGCVGARLTFSKSTALVALAGATRLTFSKSALVAAQAGCLGGDDSCLSRSIKLLVF